MIKLIKNLDDFRKIYIKKYPNEIAYIFGYFSFSSLFLVIYFSFSRIMYKDNPKQKTNYCLVYFTKSMVIIIYLSYFFGYYLYFIFCYLEINRNGKYFSLIKKMKTEKVIKDLIDIFYSNYRAKRNFILVEIILLSVSFILFISGWILHIYLSILIKKNKIKFIINENN